MIRVRIFLNCVAVAASSTQPQSTIEPAKESACVIDNFLELRFGISFGSGPFFTAKVRSWF